MQPVRFSRKALAAPLLIGLGAFVLGLMTYFGHLTPSSFYRISLQAMPFIGGFLILSVLRRMFFKRVALAIEGNVLRLAGLVRDHQIVLSDIQGYQMRGYGWRSKQLYVVASDRDYHLVSGIEGGYESAKRLLEAASIEEISWGVV